MYMVIFNGCIANFLKNYGTLPQGFKNDLKAKFFEKILRQGFCKQ